MQEAIESRKNTYLCWQEQPPPELWATLWATSRLLMENRKTWTHPAADICWSSHSVPRIIKYNPVISSAPWSFTEDKTRWLSSVRHLLCSCMFRLTAFPSLLAGSGIGWRCSLLPLLFPPLAGKHLSSSCVCSEPSTVLKYCKFQMFRSHWIDYSKEMTPESALQGLKWGFVSVYDVLDQCFSTRGSWPKSWSQINFQCVVGPLYEEKKQTTNKKQQKKFTACHFYSLTIGGNNAMWCDLFK